MKGGARFKSGLKKKRKEVTQADFLEHEIRRTTTCALISDWKAARGIDQLKWDWGGEAATDISHSEQHWETRHHLFQKTEGKNPTPEIKEFKWKRKRFKKF